MGSTATADHCQIPSTPTAEEKEARAAYLQKQRERLVEKRRLDREKKAAAMQRAMVIGDAGSADTINRVRAADRAWAEGKSGEATKLRQAITSELLQKLATTAPTPAKDERVTAVQLLR